MQVERERSCSVRAKDDVAEKTHHKLIEVQNDLPYTYDDSDVILFRIYAS